MTIEPSAHADTRISNGAGAGNVRGSGEPKSITLASNPNLKHRHKGATSGITLESVASEWITAVSLLTTCLRALKRRFRPNLCRLISSQRKHQIGPLPLPNSCYLRCDRRLPDPSPPRSHPFTPPAASPRATTQDFVIAF